MLSLKLHLLCVIVSDSPGQFDWFQAIQFYGNLSDITIDQSTPVNIFDPKFLRSMSDLIQNTDNGYAMR